MPRNPKAGLYCKSRLSFVRNHQTVFQSGDSRVFPLCCFFTSAADWLPLQCLYFLFPCGFILYAVTMVPVQTWPWSSNSQCLLTLVSTSLVKFSRKSPWLTQLYSSVYTLSKNTWYDVAAQTQHQKLWKVEEGQKCSFQQDLKVSSVRTIALFFLKWDLLKGVCSLCH